MIKPDDGIALLSVSAANSALLAKKVKYAAVLASPEEFTLSDAIDAVLGDTATSGKHEAPLLRLYQRKIAVCTYEEGCALLPLSELFVEQSKVGPNETLITLAPSM